MEFRHNPNEIGVSSSSSIAYNSSLVRGGSAFSRPTLSSSSSLVSPRAPGGGGGGLRNGHIFGHAQTPPPSTLELAPTIIDHPPQSVAKNTDQSSISNSPPPVGASGVAASAANVKAKTSAGAAEADVSAKYKECLRNHAAALGGHVLDGCGEFMPDGQPETTDALRCAACGCHRSFHRRELDGSGGSSYFHGATRLPLLLPPPPPHQTHPHHQKQFHFGSFAANPSPAVGMPGFVHFGGGNNPSGSGGTTTESSSEERIRTGIPTAAVALPRKRFRTKFTAEQKEKMLAFAERIGWRIQRQDDAMVQQFCAEIGVRRQVLKVWMHNNKHATVRKQQQQPTPPTPPASSPPPPPPMQEQQSMVQQRNHHPQHLQ